MDTNGCTCTCPSDAVLVGSRGGFGATPAAGPDDTLVFNMTNASNDPRFQIQDIVHQMFLEVNEEGTEAAAVTTSTVDYSGGTTFRVDRPFTFFVRHETTLATLFWATIYNPTS